MKIMLFGSICQNVASCAQKCSSTAQNRGQFLVNVFRFALIGAFRIVRLHQHYLLFNCLSVKSFFCQVCSYTITCFRQFFISDVSFEMCDLNYSNWPSLSHQVVKHHQWAIVGSLLFSVWSSVFCVQCVSGNTTKGYRATVYS